jgi:hypothetical protein
LGPELFDGGFDDVAGENKDADDAGYDNDGTTPTMPVTIFTGLLAIVFPFVS